MRFGGSFKSNVNTKSNVTLALFEATEGMISTYLKVSTTFTIY